MRLLKLEINGFKSFAKKTEIHFDKGITAIIGPNGSGKSNIADAVRWVLGEQSAKTLRGSRMEDVIFNGTQTRKPQAYCEVTLTFENEDGRLPVDFAEVAVTRRVYRSGDSEYFINKNQCRLKDIQELFRDTGIGKEGYSIIGQGKVEEILSNKSDERRAAFEEAAGVMKFRVRKEEAVRKLENTSKNLLRLNDILLELEDRVGPLQEQSEKAHTYLKFRDELRDIEINIFLHQYEKAKEKISNLTETLSQLKEEWILGNTREAFLQSTAAAVEGEERSLETTLNALQQKLIGLSAGVEALAGEASVKKERLENLKKERERLSATKDQAKQLQEELIANKDALQEKINLKEQEAEQGKFLIDQQEQELEQQDEDLKRREAELEEAKNAIITAMGRISDLKSQLSRLEAMEGSIKERLSKLDELKLGNQEEKEKLEKELDEAKKSLEQAALHNEEAIKLRAQLQEEIKAHDRRMEQQNQELLKLQAEKQALDSRMKVLVELKRAHEGYYSSVKNLLRDAERNIELKGHVEGVVAEVIRVPSECVDAIEMSLGSQLQNIITPDENSAKRVIEHLRKHQYGRATLLPVSVMRSRLLNDYERGCLKEAGCLGVASELLGFDERYRGIVENLLGRTVIVTDLDAGIAISRKYKNAFRIATLKGDIINQGGSMTGGSTQKREFSLLGREQELNDLEKKRIELDQAVLRGQSAIARLKQDRDELLKRQELQEKQLQESEILLAREKDKQDIILRDMDRCHKEFEKLEEESLQLLENLAEIDDLRAKEQSAKMELEEGNLVSKEDIKNMQADLLAARKQREAVSGRVTEARVCYAALEKELDALKGEKKRLEKELASLANQEKTSQDKQQENSEMIASLERELETLQVTIDEKRKEVSDLNDEVCKLEEERQKKIINLEELRKERQQCMDDQKDLTDRIHRAELNLNKAELELSSMQDRIWNDYNLTYESAQPYRRQIQITSSHIRIGELKNAIRELGDINLNAIEDYKAVNERYQSLKTQCQDLEKAKQDLSELIEELTTSMEKEFVRQFERIKENFSKVFEELFGGGKAELVLSNPNDILNCDIDIIAQPPGKKLQLLSLLSGGERALTAIALLFAILKLKPTAFCILDEIESSLDETNVTNFAEYLRVYAEDTQFILITHRKGSMQVSNALYGVAMEEKGVSSVVSARFNEAV